MHKNYIITFLIGITGGIAAFAILATLNGGIFISGTKLKGEIESVVNETQQNNSQLLPANSSDNSVWQKITDNESLSSVAVEAFVGSAYSYKSSGVIVSSDGLIITTADLVPIDSTAIQILTGDKIFKAWVVARNSIQDLVLLRSSATNLTVSNLYIPPAYNSGQELLITGKLIKISKPIIFSQKALINYSSDSTILDTTANQFINGGKVVDNNQNVIGISAIRNGTVLLIPSNNINSFLNNYLVGGK